MERKNLSEIMQQKLLDAIHSYDRVAGYTHTFYRYPARFSPSFARIVIEAFTKPGDFVFDPFVGGGTTIVEACLLGRQALGLDISSLAVFIAKVKTTPLTEEKIDEINSWVEDFSSLLNLRHRSIRPICWINTGYQRNINTRSTWPIRKSLELGLLQIEKLSSPDQQRFARCVLLRTAQWALDGRRNIPSANQFREKFQSFYKEMIHNLRKFNISMCEAFSQNGYKEPIFPICVQKSVIDINSDKFMSGFPHPKLILTSPPYPGVHILYHRWQISGRKETPAPFWIADCEDEKGESYYTFGSRKSHCLGKYYEELERAFRAIARTADKNTIIVQLVGFSDPISQLPKYISVLDSVGLSEIKYPMISETLDSRIWRIIPNRKWYADLVSKERSGKEVVLFHRLR